MVVDSNHPKQKTWCGATGKQELLIPSGTRSQAVIYSTLTWTSTVPKTMGHVRNEGPDPKNDRPFYFKIPKSWTTFQNNGPYTHWFGRRSIFSGSLQVQETAYTLNSWTGRRDSASKTRGRGIRAHVGPAEICVSFLGFESLQFPFHGFSPSP